MAKTDPFKQISEYVGSGPMKFARGEWVPGARAAFERFADYVPRPEPHSWLQVLPGRFESKGFPKS